jgi:TetR/AcrR family transcriptional regulator, transcriptional repressor for nem operon
MGRVSKERATENRSRIVAAASSLFRRKGFDGVGIAELMAEAGLTHGGFYGQFNSKDELAGEACTAAFAGAERAWRLAVPAGESNGLARLADFYFAPKAPGQGCPMAALAGDAARAEPGGPVRRAFTTGLRRLATLIGGGKQDDKALVMLAAMVGAVALREASEDDTLAASIQAAVLRFAAGQPEQAE